jgi:OOP family OmpA-OmpF porin
MNIHIIKITFYLSLIAAMVACTTTSSKIAQDGRVEEAIFPDISEAWRKEGTMPSPAAVAKVRPGLAKDRLYALLGPPHFDEGFIAVREWDYIFTFKNAAYQREDVCQFKIIYDPQMRVQETFWKPAECVAHAYEAPMPTMQAEKAQQPYIEKSIEKVIQREKETIYISNVKLNADGLFAFGKHGLDDVLPGGRNRLDRALSGVIHSGDLVSIKVLGYTDRLGSDQYNMALSEARAATIKNYLVSQGIPPEKITTNGLGKTAPVVACEQETRDAQLIDCLQPNRRFEIEVETTSKQSVRE